VLVILLLAGALGAAPVRADDGAPVVYATGPEAVVVRYVEVPGELEDVDAGPVLTVYGDGRATVRYPRYMKRAGEYEIVLARAEVDALVASLADKGVAEFQAPAVRQQVHAVQAARATTQAGAGGGETLFVVTDPSTTIIELNLGTAAAGTAAAAPDGGAPRGLVAGRAVWSGLAGDATQHPSVTALVDLAAARVELRAVMERVHTEATP
jgi:hypothetical protein